MVLFDTMDNYRPVNMNEHVDFVQYYDPNIKDPKPANPAQTIADDIEEKWRRNRLSSPVVRVMGILILLGGLTATAPRSQAEDASNPPAVSPGSPGSGQPPAGQSLPGQPPSSTKQAPSTKQTPTAFQEPTPDCAGGEEFKNLANTTNSSAIVYNGNLIPAGTTVDFGLTTSLEPNAHYFALLLKDDTRPTDDTIGHGARARKASETDDLVARHLLSPGQTIVSYDVPGMPLAFGQSAISIFISAACEGHSTCLTYRCMSVHSNGASPSRYS